VSVIGHLKDRRRAHDPGRAVCCPGRAAVRRYPSSAGTNTEPHVAQPKAKEEHKDPADHQGFVASTREQLDLPIERGEPLPATLVRARAQAQAPNSRQKRDLVRERALG
jgi:hypothetical protein